MAINAETALRAITIILKNERDKTKPFEVTALKTVGSLVGSLAAGSHSGVRGIAGGLLGGWVGGLIGEQIGEQVADIRKNGKSLSEVVDQDLTPEEKQELARIVLQVISRFKIVNEAVLIKMCTDNDTFQKDVLECIRSFVQRTGRTFQD